MTRPIHCPIHCPMARNATLAICAPFPAAPADTGPFLLGGRRVEPYSLAIRRTAFGAAR